MKFFTKRKNIQKIILVLVTLILCNFIVPTYSHADVGGILMAPVVSLVAVVFDGINWLMQYAMLGQTSKIYSDKDTVYESVKVTDATDEEKALPTILIDKQDLNGKYKYPNVKYTPAEIFTGKVPALSINFFSSTPVGATETEQKDNENRSIAYQLREIISSWYIALRNLAVIGLLSVLVYLGIRMIISVSNEQKAKYKEHLVDWLVAMCLVFFLHYIMAFTINMTDAVTAMIASGTQIENGKVYETKIMVVSDAEVPTDGKTIYDQDELSLDDYKAKAESKGYFKTNLMGAARFQLEYADFDKKIGYLIIYVAFTVYTVMFTYTYLKRVLNMAFLTVIAPLVALTYPIDKASDGQAQAFNMWIKEYVYNALLQPLHLLIYTILVTSAIQLAATNMIYAVVAMSFIKAAEKLLKQMFNFKNSQTGGGLGDFAKGAVASSLMRGGRGILGGGNAKGGINPGGTPNTNKISSVKSANAPKGLNSLGVGLPPGNPSLHGTVGAATQANGANTTGTRTGVGAGTANGTGTPSPNVGGTPPPNVGGTNQSNNQGEDNTGATPTVGPTLQEQADTARKMGEVDEEDFIGKDFDDLLYDEANRQYENNLNDQIRQVETPELGETAPEDIETPEDEGDESLISTDEELTGDKKWNELGVGEKFGRLAGFGANKVSQKWNDAGGTKGMAIKGAKGLAKIGGTIGGAAVGAGIGAAMGEGIDDILMGAAGGAASGKVFTRKLANGTESTLRGAKGLLDEAKHGEQEAASRKANKQFMENRENREFFRQKFKTKNEKELKEVMGKAVKYREAGITDLDRIKEGIKIEGQLKEESPIKDETRKEKIAQRQAIELTRLSKQYSDDVFTNQNKYNQAVEALSERFKGVQVKQNGQTRNLTQAEAEDRARKSMERIREQRLD